VGRANSKGNITLADAIMTKVDLSNAEKVMRARCADCGWEWIVAYLPMEIRKACTLMMKACCPKCAAGGKKILCMWDQKRPPAPKRPDFARETEGDANE
jgi:hypothetical protein